MRDESHWEDVQFADPVEEVEIPEFIFPDEEDEKPKNDALEQRLAQVEAQNREIVTRQLQQPPTYEQTYRAAPVHQYQMAPQPPPPQIDRADLNKRLTEQIMLDPLAYTQAVYEQVKRDTVQQVMGAVIPQKVAQVRSMVRQYVKDEGLDEPVKKEFERLLSGYSDQDVASVDPAMVPTILNSVRKVALANAVESGYIPPSRKAPNYGGSSGGGSGGGNTKSTFKPTREQAFQIKSLKEDYGWSDKQIAAAIKKGEI